ncbi:MAG: hypothetical protein AAFR35_03095 [Pseudomonadota bacterium]
MRGYSTSREDYLFHKGDWRPTQKNLRKKLVDEIGTENGDKLLNTSTNDLAKYYADKFVLKVPQLQSDEIVVDQRETQVDISQDINGLKHDRSRPYHISGTAVDVEVPFTGDPIGFQIQPSTRNFNHPRAYVGDGVLQFTISGADLTADKVKAEIERRIASIEEHLGWLSNDVRVYNDGLLALATQTIERRKEKLLKDKSLLAELGFKMKSRPGQNETFAAPKVRRKIKPATPKPTASREPFKPEPTLTLEDYEHILSVLENMEVVMEQSPGAFREIDEESLRTHFLMQLNGHFQGDATGETFNYEGKTDILIKVDGRNIFIGECKFWTGEKGYLETLDQVLSYLSWRDTKAAVLVFNRNKDFSGVLEKIEQATSKHENCKKLVKKRSESSWTYLFGHKDDANREISITVQAYNVPERIEPRIRSLGV